jgi:molybdopterin molybdotransferase
VVRDSFGPTLPAIIRMLGGVVIGSRRVPDRIEAMVESIAAAAVSSDVIITTGSTGGSASDFLREALGALGGELIVDGVAIRPGAPSMLATLPGGAHLVGLPGNPLAAMLGLSVLAAPLLAAAEGTPMPETTELRLDSAVLGKLGVTTLIPVRIVDGFAVPVDWRGSAMMRGFADASHIVACPPDGIDRGETATAVEVPWH